MSSCCFYPNKGYRRIKYLIKKLNANAHYISVSRAYAKD